MSNWLKMLTPARHVVHVTNIRYDSLLSVRPFLSVTLLSRKWDHCSLKGEGDLYSGQRSPTLFGLTDDMHKSSAAKGREEPSKFKFQNVPFFIDWPRLTHQEGCIIQELLKVVAACLTKYLPTGTFCQRSQARC